MKYNNYPGLPIEIEFLKAIKEGQWPQLLETFKRS